MTSTTFSVERAEGELGDRLAEGHVKRVWNATHNERGWLRPVLPWFWRPGQEKIWAGAGGVISTARDLATWVAMLLNDGRHPFTNEVVVPAEVIDFVSTGLVSTRGKPEFPETSVIVYGAGVSRYSYQGHDIIEHGGALPGFKSQVTRFPGSASVDDVTDLCPGTKNHGLGIVVLSNDGEVGNFVHDAAKWRIADDVLGLKEVDWTSRYLASWNSLLTYLPATRTPPPENPTPPTAGFEALGKQKFEHPAYGPLIPCLVPASMPGANSNSSSITIFENPHTNCPNVLSQPSVQLALANSQLDRPTYMMLWDRGVATVQRLTHFDGNLFNVTVVWSNADTRQEEGYEPISEDDEAIVIDLFGAYQVGWVSGGGEEEGLSFRGDFWGIGGPPAEAPPAGLGKESAEVWFTASP